MNKKWIAGILSAGLLLQAAGAATFTDVGDEYAWAKDAISSLADQKIILGVSEGVYAPEDNVTREQLAALTVRSLEITGDAPETATFTDVSKDAWSFEAVELAKEFFGAAEGAFEPEKAADRLTVASVLVNAIDKQIPDLAYTEQDVVFTDTDNLSDVQKEAVRKAAVSGIINGYPDGTFGPEKNVTRAEVAVMIDRVLKIKESAQPTPSATPEEPTATPSPTASGEPTATPSATPTPTATSTASPATKSRGEFMVVKSVATVTGTDGESAVKVTGYLEGEEISIEVKEGEVKNVSGIEENGTKIRVGDVIAFVKDIKGEVADCNIIFKASTAVENRKVVNPYGDEGMAVEKQFGYFNTGYGLVRRAQNTSLELVYDDTVAANTSGKSASYSIGKTANFYIYDITGRDPEVKISDMSDISEDKTVGEVAQSDEGNFVFVREKDGVVTDVLILNGDFS